MTIMDDITTRTQELLRAESTGSRTTTTRWTWWWPPARARCSPTSTAPSTSTSWPPTPPPTSGTGTRRWSPPPVSKLDRVTLTSRAFHHDQWRFADGLARLVGKDMVLPMNTGAEAVETGIKLARAWGYLVKGVPDGQAKIIVAAGNFHGHHHDHQLLRRPAGA